MKRAWLTLLGGLAAGLLGYACIYFHATAAQRSIEQTKRPELAWLKTDYHLSDSQFAQVVQLHDAYYPKCVEMCRRINEQNAKVQELLGATNAVTSEIKQALTQAAQLRMECQAAMMQHFYEVSRAMPTEEGKRYLAWVQKETLVPGQMVPIQPSTKANQH